jgi:hypothetical protein
MPWKIALPTLCIALISGAAVTWQVFRVRANGLKLAQDAVACRVRAEQGDAKAEANLGNMYSHGRGVPQDYAEALRWYRKAAEQGDANGQDGLGSMYYYGHGLPQDYAEALRWYRKAADQSDAKAENGIALLYSQGQGVSQDYTESLRWYRKAVDQGYAPAQYNLGNMYYYGRGVPLDRAQAERWYQKAADQGDEYAQRALGLRGSGLTRPFTISVSVMLLACWTALKDVILPPPRPDRERQPRALTTAGLCGLAYIGLSVYGAFGSFPSVLAVNAFHFAKSLAAGITVGLLITVFGPKNAKVVLGISGALLIVHDLVVISHHALGRFVTTVRGFNSVNGLLIGIAVPLVIFVWLDTRKRARDRGGLIS